MSDVPDQFAIHVAALAFRVDRRQLDRDLKHKRFPNAYFGERGGWMIPREDLEAAGYKLDQRWSRSWRAIVRQSERRAEQRTAAES